YYFPSGATSPGGGKMQKSLEFRRIEFRERLIKYDKALEQEEALEELRTRAETGDPQSQYQLGSAFDAGQLGMATDHVEAVKWFRKAAEHDDAAAQCSLGRCYANGLGLAKDEVEALKWYRRASEQNDVRGQNALAWLLATSANPAIR